MSVCERKTGKARNVSAKVKTCEINNPMSQNGAFELFFSNEKGPAI